MATTTPGGQPIVSRDKTTPFLIRTFLKIGGFHRLSLFEDGALPTTDEQQIFTWKDATLREVLTTIRNCAPTPPEFRHPLARYSFRAVYADAANRGRYAQKDLGVVYSRDILGEPGTLHSTAPRLLENADGEGRELTEREKEERTLEELRFVPGDFLCVAIMLPKNITMPAPTGDIAVKGAGAAPPPASNGWRSGTGTRDGWASSSPLAGPGRGSGHWRGDSNAPTAPGGVGRGRGGRGGDFAGRDRDYDRYRDGDRDRDRRPPPRRPDSPVRRDRDRRERSRSRTRSPPRRRNSRYD